MQQALQCSFFSQLAIPFAGVHLQPREHDDLVWFAFFSSSFLVINQHSVKSLLCTFWPSTSDACKYLVRQCKKLEE